MDYPAFFDGLRCFQENLLGFSAHELEFILYNILAYIGCAELAVRKTVSSSLKLVLGTLDVSRR
jgi:hypothetical protein